MNKNLLIVKHNQLEGERIILRPISLDEAEDMYEYTSDEEMIRYNYSMKI